MNLHNAGIAALTVGSIMEGVLEIYGTTNDLVQVYWFSGIGLAGTGFILYAAGLLVNKKNRSQRRDL